MDIDHVFNSWGQFTNGKYHFYISRVGNKLVTGHLGKYTKTKLYAIKGNTTCTYGVLSKC